MLRNTVEHSAGERSAPPRREGHPASAIRALGIFDLEMRRVFENKYPYRMTLIGIGRSNSEIQSAD